MMAPTSCRNGLSFFVGWMATAGWIALAATAAALGSTFVTGIISLWHPNYVMHPWHQFVIFLAFLLQAFLLNVFAVRLLPLIDRFAGSWSMVGIVTVVITCLACAKGEYQPASEVFAKWTNETGVSCPSCRTPPLTPSGPMAWPSSSACSRAPSA